MDTQCKWWGHAVHNDKLAHISSLTIIRRKSSCTRNHEPLPRARWDTPAPQLPAGQSCRYQTRWVRPRAASTEKFLFSCVLLRADTFHALGWLMALCLIELSMWITVDIIAMFLHRDAAVRPFPSLSVIAWFYWNVHSLSVWFSSLCSFCYSIYRTATTSLVDTTAGNG